MLGEFQAHAIWGSHAQGRRACTDRERMRLLALMISLQVGCLFATTVSEYESLIRAETSLEKKLTIAEEAFASIEGFVPREMFMSFWSIDVLGEIAPEFERRLQSEGLRSLLPEYDLIRRICSMEMGDYRYFFHDLKSDLEELESSHFHSSLASNSSKPQQEKPHLMELLWDEPLISNLVEAWIAMGYGEGIEDELLDDLLATNVWEIEYWQELIHRLDGNPKAVIKALAWRKLARGLIGTNVYRLDFSNAPVELGVEKVSEVGPRFY